MALGSYGLGCISSISAVNWRRSRHLVGFRSGCSRLGRGVLRVLLGLFRGDGIAGLDFFLKCVRLQCYDKYERVLQMHYLFSSYVC